MRVAILGYGRFGASFADLLLQAGIPVQAYDAKIDVPPQLRRNSPAELVHDATHVIVATPVSAMTTALGTISPYLGPQHFVMDVGSVKVRPVEAMGAALGSRVPWVGTHPLFGPVSLARAERPLRAIVCPSPLHPLASRHAREFFVRLGCEVIEWTAEQHDRFMARTHALAFFVAKGFLAMGGGQHSPFAPPSYQAIANSIDAVRADAGHLFRAIQQENPFAEEARQTLLSAMQEIHADLEMDDDPESEDAPDAKNSFMFAIPSLDAKLPELLEARAQIDELDREIVELLGRRADLAARAASAKEAIGRGIVDPTREAQLMEVRRDWAEQADLDANAVEEVFRAVIRFSRAMQGRKVQ